MSSVKVEINGMSEAVQTLLKQYGDEAFRALDECVREVTKESVAELKTAGDFVNRTGQYRKSWKSQIKSDSKGTEATIYNENAHLTHLLENGHVIKGGKGRTKALGTSKAFPHIAPVQEKAVESLINKMERKLG